MTMDQDSWLSSSQVHGIQKRYDQEKYYVFIMRVERANQPDPTYIFRTYKSDFLLLILILIL